jgi:hypothetical protein
MSADPAACGSGIGRWVRLMSTSHSPRRLPRAKGMVRGLGAGHRDEVSKRRSGRQAGVGGASHSGGWETGHRNDRSSASWEAAKAVNGKSLIGVAGKAA